MLYTCNFYCVSATLQIKKKKRCYEGSTCVSGNRRRVGRRRGDLSVGLMMKALPVPVRLSQMDPPGWVFMPPACSIPGCNLPLKRTWPWTRQVSAAETRWRPWQLETICPLALLLAATWTGKWMVTSESTRIVSFQHLDISWILKPPWNTGRVEVLTWLHRWVNWGRTSSETVLSRSSKPGLQSPPPVPLWPRARTQWKE